MRNDDGDSYGGLTSGGYDAFLRFSKRLENFDLIHAQDSVSIIGAAEISKPATKTAFWKMERLIGRESNARQRTSIRRKLFQTANGNGVVLNLSAKF